MCYEIRKVPKYLKGRRVYSLEEMRSMPCPLPPEPKINLETK